MPHAVFVWIHVRMSLSSATVCNFDDTILATYIAMELDLGKPTKLSHKACIFHFITLSNDYRHT